MTQQQQRTNYWMDKAEQCERLADKARRDGDHELAALLNRDAAIYEQYAHRG